MTDKELLEKAAKATGIDGVFRGFHRAYGGEWTEGIDYGGRLFWNPLTDDGDALRLAVKLRILVSPESNYVNAINDLGAEICEMYSDRDGDAMVATRRAITRAAASMVKG